MRKKQTWILLTVITFFVIMSADRLFLLFTSAHLNGISKNIFSALWLGMRYDLRELGIVAFVMLILSFFRFLDPFRSGIGRKVWLVILSVISVVAVLVYVADTLHFDYLAQRLNASVLNFIPEGQTSAMMVWQTYPVLRILLLTAVLSIVIIYFLRKAMHVADRQTKPQAKKWNAVSITGIILLAAFCIFGRLNQYPLRWSDAFGLRDGRLSQLALNPFQSFFSTLSFRKVSYDEKTSRKYYPLMAAYLGIDTTVKQEPWYYRKTAGTATTKPNVVLVICESFSGYKSSMWGNPLDPTPFFNSLSKEGIFFDHCFTPHFGTARGVWATITGIPDVLLDKTATRNPLIVDQHSIISDFDGYEKDYFIGGSTSWANIKGLLEDNIENVTIHEQGSYDAPKVDVWGISDKNLFLQANEILRNKKGPFFTVIQTSDNHRPYTIPKDDRAEFKLKTYPRDTLVKYGFQTNEELNAFRYTDFCFEKFIEAARKEKYFANTLFVFVGDHGIRGNAGNMFPKAWTNNSLTAFHVPLLFYAPSFISPQRHSMIASQVDVLPTIAGIAGITYNNSALGRDLLHLKDTATNTAFVIDHDVRTLVTIHGDYVFQHNFVNDDEQLASIRTNDRVAKDISDSISNRMREMTFAFYETSRYMLFNNKKKKK